MQFAVPQFTDVEDKIVANLSFKQFGIVFAAGILVFVVFTISKNLPATIVAGIIFGIPAIIATFGKINGQPIYKNIGNFVGYVLQPKVYVFHKQAQQIPETEIAKVEIKEQKPVETGPSAAVRIKQLNYLLQQQASEEGLLLERIAKEKTEKSQHG